MASSIAKATAGSLAKDLRDDLQEIRAGKANLRIDAKNLQIAPEFRAFRHLVREAMRIAGVSQKEFAIDAGQSEGTVSDAFAGNRHLAAEWVWAQKSEAFHVALIELMRTERGLSDEREQEEDEELIGILLARILRYRRKAATA